MWLKKKTENIKITYNKYMKIIFNTKALLDKIKNIAPTAEAKQTLMILGNMIMKVNDNKAHFIASDLEIQVSSSMDCDSDGDCEFSLPARKVLEILNALSSYETVTFSVSDAKVDITAGKSKISLPTLPTTDFPFMDIDNIGEETDIETGHLSNIINKTSFAMAYQDTSIFSMVYLCNEGKIVSVCTDGTGWQNINHKPKLMIIFQCKIPRKAILEINQFLNSFNDNSKKIMKYSYNSTLFRMQITIMI